MCGKESGPIFKAEVDGGAVPWELARTPLTCCGSMNLRAAWPRAHGHVPAPLRAVPDGDTALCSRLSRHTPRRPVLGGGQATLLRLQNHDLSSLHWQGHWDACSHPWLALPVSPGQSTWAFWRPGCQLSQPELKGLGRAVGGSLGQGGLQHRVSGPQGGEAMGRVPGEPLSEESRSVVSDSATPWTVYGLWNSPGQNTGVGSLSLLQESSQPRDRTQVSHVAGGFFSN